MSPGEHAALTHELLQDFAVSGPLKQLTEEDVLTVLHFAAFCALEIPPS
jgi:hypothetical protein